MRLPVGLVLLSDAHSDAPPLSAAGTVSKDDAWDHGGYALGCAAAAHGTLVIDRPYVTGNPSADWLAAKARRNHAAGLLSQLGNEQNHPVERFQGTPDDWFVLHNEACARLTQDERESVIASPPSPGFDGWQAWVNRTARKHAVHCYGDLGMMQATVQWFLDNTAADLYVTECNPGAGNRFDLNAWATQHLRPFLEWCDRQPQVKAVLYFAWKWNESAALPSSVDAAGSAVTTVLQQWVEEASDGADDRGEVAGPEVDAQPGAPTGVRPPEGPPGADAGDGGAATGVLDAALPAETVVIRGIDISNNNGAVDLARAKAAGYEFVVVKIAEDDLGEDDFFDTFAGANLAHARALEIGVGIYTFIRPSKSSPAESIGLIQRAVARVGGLRAGEFIALDCEDDLYDGDLHVWFAEALALGVQALGQPIWKYSADWYTSTRNLEHADLAPAPTWWASYQDELPTPQVGWGPIRMWQNGVVGPGAVPGVVGQCDVNIFYGSLDELRATGKPADAVEPAAPEPAAPIEQPTTAPRPPDMLTAALDNVFSLTLEPGPPDEARRVSAQAAIGVLKVALGRQAAA